MSERADRLLARVDAHLPKLNRVERLHFLEDQVRKWERSYNLFLATDGLSENNENDPDPVGATDYLLTITGLQARFDAVSHPADCRCRVCSFSPLYIKEKAS